MSRPAGRLSSLDRKGPVNATRLSIMFRPDATIVYPDLALTPARRRHPPAFPGLRELSKACMPTCRPSASVSGAYMKTYINWVRTGS